MRNILKETKSNITKIMHIKRLVMNNMDKFIFIMASLIFVNKVQTTFIQKIEFNNQTDYAIEFISSSIRWSEYDKVYIPPQTILAINFQYPVKPKILYTPLRVYNIRASISHLMNVYCLVNIPIAVGDIVEEMCIADSTKKLFLNTQLTEEQHKFVITYKGKNIFDISEET